MRIFRQKQNGKAYKKWPAMNARLCAASPWNPAYGMEKSASCAASTSA